MIAEDVARGRVFGVIKLVNEDDGTSFSPLELKILVTIADVAAITIEKVYETAAPISILMFDIDNLSSNLSEILV